MATAIDKNAVIIKAVNELKNNELFGATALKVELEAQLNRRSDFDDGYDDDDRDSDGYCTRCEEGQVECPDCYGSWEEQSECEQCEGTGEYEHVLEDGISTETRECEDCDGIGYFNCEYCDEGRVSCSQCDGEYHLEPEEQTGGQVNYGREVECYNFIMERLSRIGLAESLTEEQREEWADADRFIDMRSPIYSIASCYGRNARYQPKHPLIYGRFYFDGSVDSEFTFTVAMDNPENVFLLPKVVEVFNDLAAEIGHGCNTSGAGMHMAVIDTPDCTYPSSTPVHDRGFQNLSRSMALLMPALFFLSSCSDKSRGLNYRRPEVGWSTHGSAINFEDGAIEFRVFETCYERPDAILDNVVVMSKCMQFYRREYKPSGVEKAIKELRFGTGGQGVDRFFTTVKHIDALSAGITKLKPEYYTVTELKAQRGFKKTRRTFMGLEQKNRKQAELEFKEYQERQAWLAQLAAKETEWSFMRSAPSPKGEADRQAIKKDATEKAKKTLERYQKETETLPNFVARRIRELAQINEGNYTLKCE